MDDQPASPHPERAEIRHSVFLIPFGIAAYVNLHLTASGAMLGLGAAIFAAIAALLVGCALCVRVDDVALFCVAAGLWAVAAAFLAMPHLLGDMSAAVGAFIAVADLSFCAMVTTDRLSKDLGLGKAGRMASSAISVHGVLLAALFAYGGPFSTLAYMIFLTVHAYGLRKSFEKLAATPQASSSQAR